MSYRIEVTGENIQAVFQDVMNLAIVMGQGGTNAFRAPTPPAPDQPVGDAPTSIEENPNRESRQQDPGVTAEPNPQVAPLPAEKRKPGRPAKVQVIEAVAEEVKPDPLDLIGDGTEPATMEAKTFTLKDDIQPRLRAIDDAYKVRNNKPGIDAKALQAASVNYMVQLLSKFDAKSTRELKPDQFAGFMAESVAYLDGTAAEVA